MGYICLIFFCVCNVLVRFCQKWIRSHTVGSDGTGIPASRGWLRSPEASASHYIVLSRKAFKRADSMHILVITIMVHITKRPPLAVYFSFKSYLRMSVRYWPTQGKSTEVFKNLPHNCMTGTKYTHLYSIGPLLSTALF